jgi:hypothetical protein
MFCCQQTSTGIAVGSILVHALKTHTFVKVVGLIAVFRITIMYRIQ